MKNLILITLLGVFGAVGCTDETATEDATATATTTEQPTEEEKKQRAREEMKKIANSAVDEGDLAVRAERGIRKMMPRFNEAAEVIDGYDNPTIEIDTECNVVYTYDERGVTYTKRFNIADFEHRGGKMKLAADNGDDVLFPGFRLLTADGEASVIQYKAGEEVNRDNEWYVVLANREAVQEVVPNMVNIINICHDIRKGE